MKHAVTLLPETESLFTRQQLAKRHQVSIETLKRRERAGQLRFLKQGRGVRYRLSDILAYEQASEVRA